jgi:histidyl-tRNA synthetase
MKMQTAKGVKDTPPEEKIVKNEVVDKLRKVFELYGFVPLETPIIERFDTLTAKFAAGEGSDAKKEIFKLNNQGKRDLGLRFDLTVPLARFIAMNPSLKLPFKRYAVGPVFRDGPIKLGRSREFWQMDVDTIGASSMLADAEMVAVADTFFKEIGLDVVIKINNRKLLSGILEQAGIEKKEEAIISIDKLDKIGREGVSEELQDKNYTKEQIDKAFEFLSEDTVEKLKKKITNELGKQGLEELEELFNYLKSMNIKSVKFENSLARGLAYYTGTVFEIYLKKGEITSSIAAGGRYDDMVGKYMGGGRIIPAVGISFGLVPIMETLKLMNKIQAKSAAKVLVIPINTINESLNIVQQLRNNGVPTDFAIGKKGVSKNLQYADSLGIPYVAIIGENELKKEKILLRNMSSGEEQMLAIEGVIKKFK